NLRLGVSSGVLLLGLFGLLVAGCGQGVPTNSAVEVELDTTHYRLSGPVAHENVSVFLIHSSCQDERDFLTLGEGLQNGQVRITEKEQASVRSLEIDNQSDRPLYLQEGERLQGGQQDRTIASSMVVPAKSGVVNVPTFCIEQRRWQEGSKGKEFGF